MGKDLEFDRVKADNTDGFGGKIRVLAQPLPRCRFDKRSCWKRSGTSAEDIFSSRKKVQAGGGREYLSCMFCLFLPFWIWELFRVGCC